MPKQTPSSPPRPNAPLSLSEQLEALLNDNEAAIDTELRAVFGPLEKETDLPGEAAEPVLQPGGGKWFNNSDIYDSLAKVVEGALAGDNLPEIAEPPVALVPDRVDPMLDRQPEPVPPVKEKLSRAARRRKAASYLITVDGMRDEINGILALNEVGRSTHYRMSLLGLTAVQISSVTGAAITNVSRDIWAFRTGRHAKPVGNEYVKRIKK